MFLEQFWKQKSYKSWILLLAVGLVCVEPPRWFPDNKMVVYAQQQQQPPNNQNNPNNNNQTDGICKKMSNNNGNDRLKILCVGLFYDSIILITENFYVYELNRSSLSSTITSLYIDSKPVKLATKWPVLAADSSFRAIQGVIFNSFTMVDSSSEYVLFTVQQATHPDLGGVDFDIRNNRVFSGMQYEGTDYQVLLSTDLPLTFYALHQDVDKSNGLMIATYKATTKTLTAESNINIVTDFVPLCENGADQIYISADPKEKCTPVQWPVLKGFVDSGHFYLFGTDFVFKFEQSVYTKPNTNVKVKKTLYSGFFKCGAIIPPVVTKSSIIGIIIAAILLLLLILLLLILCLRKQKIEAERRRKAKIAAAAGPVPVVPVPLVASSSSKSQLSHSRLSVRSAQSIHSKAPFGMLSRTAAVSGTNSRLSTAMTGRSKLSGHGSAAAVVTSAAKSRTKLSNLGGQYGGGSVNKTSSNGSLSKHGGGGGSQTKLSGTSVTASIPKLQAVATPGGASVASSNALSGAGSSRASRAITGRSAISKRN